jgi:hypothetical protein
MIFLMGVVLRLRLMVVVFERRALLLRCKDLSLNVGEVIGLRFAPRFLGLLLGFEVGHLRGRQLFTG